MSCFNKCTRSFKGCLHSSAVYAIAAVAIFMLLAWPSIGSQGDTAAAADACSSIKVSITPDVPHDYPTGERPQPSEETSAVLAALAWQQFLALTWQSNYSPSQPTRGTPDTDWSYKMPYKEG